MKEEETVTSILNDVDSSCELAKCLLDISKEAPMYKGKVTFLIEFLVKVGITEEFVTQLLLFMSSYRVQNLKSYNSLVMASIVHGLKKLGKKTVNT